MSLKECLHSTSIEGKETWAGDAWPYMNLAYTGRVESTPYLSSSHSVPLRLVCGLVSGLDEPETPTPD
jgi:hypothetical protein